MSSTDSERSVSVAEQPVRFNPFANDGKQSKGGKPMYKKLNESFGNVLGFKISGELTERERDEMMEEIEATLKDAGKINFVLEFEELEEEPSVLFDDLKFSARFFERFSRMACIAEPKWKDWFEKLAGVFFITETHFFDTNQRELAMQWIRKEITTEALFRGDAVQAMRK